LGIRGDEMRCLREVFAGVEAAKKFVGGHARKCFVDARLAEPALDRLREANKDRADVVIERNMLGRGFDAAILTEHDRLPRVHLRLPRPRSAGLDLNFMQSPERGDQICAGLAGFRQEALGGRFRGAGIRVSWA
jgi:hypothetical protein